MLYDIAFLIFSIFYLPVLIFKGKLHGDFLERFGRYDKDKAEALHAGGPKIWIQAVSVGEVALCGSLIPKLRGKFPDNRVVLSTITKAGNDLAKKMFSNDAAIMYFPLDLSFVVKKVVGMIDPKIYVMIETEIWPNVLSEVSRRGIPSILINGRISDKSFGAYRTARPFLKNILKKVSLFCMQSEVDAARVIELGAPAKRVSVTGIMKFDVDLGRDAAGSEKMKALLGIKEGDQLFVAGSTHNGEEEAVLKIYKNLLERFPRLKLLIAPRHVERTAEIEKTIKQFGFNCARISTSDFTLNAQCPMHVFILDTIGQLRNAYSIATIVFIGGSLVRHGGQNPIEAAMFERPVIFGPHMFNFRMIAEALVGNKAAVRVADEEGLLEESDRLLKDENLRSLLGRNAKKVIEENRGATEKNLRAMEQCATSFIR